MPKMFGAKFPLAVKKEKIIFSSDGTSLAANTVWHIGSIDQGSDLSGYAAGGESGITQNWHLVTRKGVIHNLSCQSNIPAGAGQSFIYLVRVNFANTAITCTTSGAAQVVSTDVVNKARVNPGDVITLRCTTSLTAASTTHKAALQLDTYLGTNDEYITFSTDGTTIAGGLTRYIYSGSRAGNTTGSATTAANEILTSYAAPRKGTLATLIARVSGAAGAGESFTYTVRVNGAPSALTCIISGAVLLTNSDLVNTVRVAVGDYVTVEIVTSAGAATKTHQVALSFQEGESKF